MLITNRDVGTIWENYLTQIQHIQYITAINEKEKKNSHIYFVYFLLLITSKASG